VTSAVCTESVAGIRLDELIAFVGTGFGLPEGNVHSPNERLLAEHIPLGVRVARGLLTEFGQLRSAQ
jgi:hypothetical protein